ncbi:MAG TPA: hypothetical protein ENI80_06925 [Acidiferrobacteraceae bacterium]|nr:hypothetical protein [Acidiferrobacteraceae bacterium]
MSLVSGYFGVDFPDPHRGCVKIPIMNILGVMPVKVGIYNFLILVECFVWASASALASPATKTAHTVSTVSATEEGVKSPGTKEDQTRSGPEATSLSPVVLEARSALRQAQDYERKNDYQAARLLYQQAIKLAGWRDSKTRTAARHGLDYKLPLRETDWRLAKGDLVGAFSLLNQAVRANQGHPERLQKITALIDRVKSIHAERQSKEASELLLPRIKQRLADYRKRTGHYPLTVEALNAVLPADQAPLKYHDIIGYKATSQAYHMLVRSKTDPKHVLSLDVTGLIQ